MSGRPPTAPPKVTARQREVARLVAAGFTNEAIARELGISHDGAKYHISELLLRLDVERREQIAEWYRAQEYAPVPSRMRALFGTPLGWAAGGIGIAILIVAMYLAFEGARDQGVPGINGQAGDPIVVNLERGAATDATWATFGGAHSGDGWESSAVGDIAGRDLMFVAFGHAGVGEIVALDRSSSQVVGTISTPPNPVIVHDAERNRLAVTVLQQLTTDSDGQSVHLPARLLIFDLEANLDLIGEFPLSTGRAPTPRQPLYETGTLVLSRDGNFAYSIGIQNMLEVVDLRSVDGNEFSVEIDMTTACSELSLAPAGASSVVAHCVYRESPRGEVVLWQFGPAGEVERSMTRADIDRTLPSVAGIQAIAVVETRDGISLLYADGTVAIADGTGAGQVSESLGAGRFIRPWAGPALILDSTRLVAPYQDGSSDPMTPADGFAVLNSTSGQVEYRFELPNHGVYAIGDGTHVVVIGEGRLDIVDLDHQTIVVSLDAAFAEGLDGLPVVS